MRKSYEVGISPKINLCNSVEVLTNSFGTVISGRQGLIIRIAKYLIRHLFVIDGSFPCKRRALYPGFPLLHRAAAK